MRPLSNSPLLLIKPRTTMEKSGVTPHMPLQPRESNPRKVQKPNETSNKTQEKNSVSIQHIKQNTSSSNKAQNDAVLKKDITTENQDASLKPNNVKKNQSLSPVIAKPANGTRTSNIPNTVDNQIKQNK